MATLTITKLGARARGAFGPAPSQAISNKAVAALETNQFIRRSPQDLIGGCGDERLDISGERLLVPPVFGGWFSAVLADALTTQLWYRPGMTMWDHAKRMSVAVRRMHPSAILCVHTDTSAGVECGCAAIATAPAVLQLLLTQTKLLSADYREQVVSSVEELLGAKYFLRGTTKLVDGLERLGVRKEVLADTHKGVAVVVNRQAKTLYDRPAFYAWCQRNGYQPVQFFEYAQWAMYRTASMLTPSQKDARLFFAAADAFNRAVPLAICNSQTMVIVRN